MLWKIMIGIVFIYLQLELNFDLEIVTWNKSVATTEKYVDIWPAPDE